MKHCFLTLTALLGFSYAVAGTHNVTFYDFDAEILSLVDQNDNTYDVSAGYADYEITDGTTLIFTLTDVSRVVTWSSEEDEKIHQIYSEQSGLYEGKYVVTIDETFPEEFEFAIDDPTITIIVGIPNACEMLDLQRGNMHLTPDCDEDGNIIITDLTNIADDNITLTVKPDYRDDGNGIDWGVYSDQIGWTCKIEMKDWFEAGVANGGVLTVGKYDVWNDNHSDYSTTVTPGVLAKLTYQDRTIRGGMWNTICLPFALDKRQMESIFGVDAVVEFESAEFAESTGLVIQCSYVDGMEARTPYLVQPESDITNLEFYNINVEGFNAKTIGEDQPVSFVGVLKHTVLNANDKSVLFIGAGNKVYYPSKNVTVKGFRGYFTVPVGSPVQGRKPRACIVVRDRQAPTGLNDNVTDSNATRKYMQDGRLVIENNGVRYNAQGLQMD